MLLCSIVWILVISEPKTEYVAVFNGLDKADSKKCFALFRTKQDYSEMKSFKEYNRKINKNVGFILKIYFLKKKLRMYSNFCVETGKVAI